jgi:hypothetical protein
MVDIGARPKLEFQLLLFSVPVCLCGEFGRLIAQTLVNSARMAAIADL